MAPANTFAIFSSFIRVTLVPFPCPPEITHHIRIAYNILLFHLHSPSYGLFIAILKSSCSPTTERAAAKGKKAPRFDIQNQPKDNKTAVFVCVRMNAQRVSKSSSGCASLLNFIAFFFFLLLLFLRHHHYNNRVPDCQCFTQAVLALKKDASPIIPYMYIHVHEDTR